VSAADVITEALIVHRSVRGKTQFDPDTCRTCGIPAMYRHATDEVLAALSAAGYVVATPEEIRAWPVEDVAELIGGEVERGWGFYTMADAGPALHVVGPWVEVRDA
jgi:hypothetical protein